MLYVNCSQRGEEMKDYSFEKQIYVCSNVRIGDERPGSVLSTSQCPSGQREEMNFYVAEENNPHVEPLYFVTCEFTEDLNSDSDETGELLYSRISRQQINCFSNNHRVVETATMFVSKPREWMRLSQLFTNTIVYEQSILYFQSPNVLQQITPEMVMPVQWRQREASRKLRHFLVIWGMKFKDRKQGSVTHQPVHGGDVYQLAQVSCFDYLPNAKIEASASRNCLPSTVHNWACQCRPWSAIQVHRCSRVHLRWRLWFSFSINHAMQWAGNLEWRWSGVWT